jgi:hypothetical protein
MGEELRALLRIIGVLALYAVAWVAGRLGFGAAISDGFTDPTTGASTKPYAEMFGLYGFAFSVGFGRGPFLDRTHCGCVDGKLSIKAMNRCRSNRQRRCGLLCDHLDVRQHRRISARN